MLNIDEIQNGIVIDHIKAGTAVGLMDLLGIAGIRIGLPGSSTATWESTDWYTVGCSCGGTTTNFLGVKCPEPESSLRAIMVEPS